MTDAPDHAIILPPEKIALQVDVAIPDSRWAGVESLDYQALARRCLVEVFRCAPLPAILSGGGVPVEISMLLANDDLIRTLNRTYRDKDSATNVLSFPQIDFDSPDSFVNTAIGQEGLESPLLLGDIILAFETVARECEEKLWTFRDYVSHLIVHAGLHLLGYDHQTDQQAETMENLEVWILRRLGIKNPYA